MLERARRFQVIRTVSWSKSIWSVALSILHTTRNSCRSIEISENVVPENLSVGAHLTTPRRGYFHLGIYVGDGRVIHYAGFKRLFRRGPVEEVSLYRLTRGRGLDVRNWVAPKFSDVTRVERARSRLGENRYRFRSNNCQHFCQWCISGRSRSLQVEAWTTRLNLWFGAIGFGLEVGPHARRLHSKFTSFNRIGRAGNRNDHAPD